MKKKLTRKWDSDRIEQAKRPPTGLVAELAGIARGVKIDDPAEGYADYLAAKYGVRLS